MQSKPKPNLPLPCALAYLCISTVQRPHCTCPVHYLYLIDSLQIPRQLLLTRAGLNRTSPSNFLLGAAAGDVCLFASCLSCHGKASLAQAFAAAFRTRRLRAVLCLPTSLSCFIFFFFSFQLSVRTGKDELSFLRFRIPANPEDLPRRPSRSILPIPPASSTSRSLPCLSSSDSRGFSASS